MELQMTTGQSVVRLSLLITAACCVAMTSALADSAGSPGEQVTVEQDSPYTVRHEVIRRDNTSIMELRRTSVSKGVTYSDLNLSKDSDVEILKDRAREAARDVCREANRRPVSPFDRRINNIPDCVTIARRQALVDVNRIVADARTGQTLAAK
jgi:UrcA family protein